MPRAHQRLGEAPGFSRAELLKWQTQAPDASPSELIKIFLKLPPSCVGKPSQPLFLTPTALWVCPHPPLLPLPPHEAPSQELFPCGAAGTAHNPDPVGHPPAAGCVSVPPAPSSPLSGLRCSGQRPPALELLPLWLPHQHGALPELWGLNREYLAPASGRGPWPAASSSSTGTCSARSQVSPPFLPQSPPELPEGLPSPLPSSASSLFARRLPPEPPPVGSAAPRGSAEPRCRSAPCGCGGAAAPGAGTARAASAPRGDSPAGVWRAGSISRGAGHAGTSHVGSAGCSRAAASSWLSGFPKSPRCGFLPLLLSAAFPCRVLSHVSPPCPAQGGSWGAPASGEPLPWDPEEPRPPQGGGGGPVPLAKPWPLCPRALTLSEASSRCPPRTER